MRVVDIINPTLQKYFGSISGDADRHFLSKDLDTLGLTPPTVLISQLNISNNI